MTALAGVPIRSRLSWPRLIPDLSRAVPWALYLYVLSIPFEMPRRAIPLEVPTLTAALFLLATVLDPRRCYGRIPPAMAWFAGWLWVALLALLATRPEDPSQTLRYGAVMVQAMLVFWASVNLMREERVLRAVLLTFIIACALRAALQLVGIALTAHSVWTGGERVTVLGQNANLSALILSAGLLAALGLRHARQHFGPGRRMLVWPLAALLIAAIVHTGSRGGLLALTAGLLVFLLHGRTAWQRLRGALAALFLLGLLGWASFQTRVMRERFAAAAMQFSLAGRELIYPALLGMVAERPLLGWGPINNQYELARRIAERVRPRRDAHNLVLEVATSTGLAGVVPFLTAVALCLGSAWRARHGRYGVLFLALLASILVGTLSGTWIASKILWLILALAAAGEAAAGAAAPAWAGPVTRRGRATAAASRWTPRGEPPRRLALSPSGHGPCASNPRHHAGTNDDVRD